MEQELTIGKVAEKAGVGVETVRFYERKGLVAQPPKRGSGFRRYPTEAVERIRFIQSARTLGFTLKEISELLALRVEPSTTCGDIQARADAKVEEIDRKVRELRRMKKALQELSASCVGSGPTSECPILDALQGRKLGS